MTGLILTLAYILGVVTLGVTDQSSKDTNRAPSVTTKEQQIKKDKYDRIYDRGFRDMGTR